MKTTYKGKLIEIVQDTGASSPSEWADTGLFIVTNHRNCYIPEPGEKRVPSDPGELLERYRKTHWIFSIEAYIHSGVCLSFSHEGNFPDRRWDVSQLGFAFAAKGEWRLSKSAKKAAACLLNEWNQYFAGDVWGYRISDADGREIESVWGFYGHDYCLAEAKSLVDAIAKRELAERIERVKAWIKNRVPLDCRTFA